MSYRRPDTARFRWLLGLGFLLLISGTTTPSNGQEKPDDPTLGKSAAIEVDSEWVWVEAGTRLLRDHDFESGYFAIVEVRSQLPVLERWDDWIQVRLGDSIGWLSTAIEANSMFVAPTTSDPGLRERQLARAIEDFKLVEQPLTMGPFGLYTDITNEKTLERLARVARKLLPTYRVRFGLDPSLVGSGTVLLFAGEADYRTYIEDDQANKGLDLHGRTTPELAVLFAGEQTFDQVASVLIHELTHLLNQGTFRMELPPWLEEGLATDLSFSKIDSDGTIRPGTVGGTSVVTDRSMTIGRSLARSERRLFVSGGAASLQILKDRWRHEALPLPLLTGYSHSEFMLPEDRGLRYSACAFLIRFLLDEDEAKARDFRSFLRSAADGAPTSADNLAASLGSPVAEIDRRFAAWLERQKSGAPRARGTRREEAPSRH